ncbi:MAG: phage resistance protein, partial [Acidobacteriota bacterium]
MTLLRDLIDIPERVHKGDFVLKLTEGVLDPGATLRQYVVTDALAKAFDQALQLIESAVTSRSSKATYLHGSFGSGKSHFMAVLYLLMNQNPRARAIPELAAVVDRHDTWLQGKRFLLVPFHLIGARNLESAVFGGYVEHLRRLHPEAAAPTVFLSRSILDNAETLRRQMGDERFFEALSETARTRQTDDGGGGGWGALDAGWDRQSYEAASEAAYDAEKQEEHQDKRRLISDVLDTFFPSYGVQAESTGAGFTSMDAGLSEIARHAAGLGY